MKNLMLVFCSCIALLTYAQDREVEIMPFQTARIDCPAGPPQEVTITNTSAKGLGVAVLDAASGKQMRGFGLGARAQAEVAIAEGQVLKLTNKTAKTTLVQLQFASQAPAPSAQDETYITFTLSNNSLRAIPLIIPGVMNPNLSPLSGSGVRLKLGQSIYFRYKGEEVLLLVVNKDIKEGQKVNIAKLINKKKQDI